MPPRRRPRRPRRPRRLTARLAQADLALFRRAADLRTTPLDRGFRGLTHAADHSKLWFAVAVALPRFGGRMEIRAAMRGTGSLALSSAVVNLVLKPLLRRARPDLRPVPIPRRLRRAPLSFSLPSGHAASALAFATGASTESRRLAAGLFPAAAAVAYSRVHVGVHYPGDVLAGALVGTAVSLLTRVPWPKAAPRAGGPPAHRTEHVATAADGAGVTIVVNHDSGSVASALDGLPERLPAARIIPVRDGAQLESGLAEAAETAGVLGICGGDGSVNDAAGLAAERGLPLLVIPGGTLNHLAFDLGIRSADDSLAALNAGGAVRVDLAEVDGRPFVNVASVGSYPDMVDARDKLDPRVGRWPAQALALLRVLARGRSQTMVIDGRERRVWMVFVGNCTYEPPGVHPSWRPRLDDGLLDVRVIDGAQPLARLRLLAATLVGRLPRSAVYDRWTARELRVELPAPGLRLARDGDTFAGSRSFTVTKRPRSLLVFAPTVVA